jgi:PTS system nitrogen regulatory IIA component
MVIGGGEGARAIERHAALIDPRLVFRNLAGQTREEVLEELSAGLAGAGIVQDAGALAARLLEREKIGCTGLGGGVAIPHCKLPGLSDVVTAIGILPHPVDFGAADGAPVDLIFLVVSPPEASAAHLQALARISRILRTPGVPDALRRTASTSGVLDVLAGAERSAGGLR